MPDPPSLNLDDNQNLVARESCADRLEIRLDGYRLDRQDFENHLSWYHVSTPFLSFSSSWNRVSRLREQKIAQGYENVTIFAIWAEDMINVYCARIAVYQLGPNFRYAHNPGIFENE